MTKASPPKFSKLVTHAVFFLGVFSAGVTTQAASTSTSTPAPAPTPAVTSDGAEKDFQNSKWEEVQSIVDDIKIQNPPDAIKLHARLGVVQTITNNQSTNQNQAGLNFGTSGGNSLGIGLDGSITLWGNLGLEARETYTQNLVPATGSNNGGSTYISWFDLGPRYTFYLDSTRLDNNIVVSLLYHDNYNNILLAPNQPTFLWVNYYSGISASIERNIPITNKLGIRGLFDLLQILNTSSPSENTQQGVTPTMNTVAKSGYGFEIQAEVYYKIIWNTLPVRVGLMYWQQGNQSELDNSIKASQGRNSYFQASRAIFATTAFLF